jgi:membrane associated rhomboid family serine protease
MIRQTVAMESSRRRLHASRDGAYTGFLVVGLLVAAMWLVEGINALDGQRLSQDGIIARHLSGLPGILSAPFLHASFSHLLDNTVPFVIFGLVIATGGVVRIVIVTVIVALVSGLGAWALSPSGSDTIGASGVVFGYATFLIARGAFTRKMLELAIGLLVAVLFGGALLLSIAPQAGISWQDHVFGAVGGVLAARALSPRRRTDQPALKE